MSKTHLEIEDEIITRPRIISVIAIFYLILGILYCLPLVAPIFMLVMGRGEKAILSFLGVLPISLIGGFSVASALGTLKLKKWAIKCLMLLSILYILFAPLIFRLLFPAYQESIFYSQIFVLSVLVYPQGLLATYLRARMKKKQLFLVTSIIPIIRATLYIILIPLYGVMGAIISIIAARTFNFGLSYYLFKKL